QAAADAKAAGGGGALSRPVPCRPPAGATGPAAAWSHATARSEGAGGHAGPGAEPGASLAQVQRPRHGCHESRAQGARDRAGVLRPEINDATIRLLARRGVDVEVAPGAGCCGALVHHMGREAEAVEFAKRNVDAWWKVMSRDRIDALIINASGCGTMVKDYGHLLARVEGYAERARKIADMTRDVTEFLSEYDLGPPKRWSSLRVAYHSACSLQHGQRVTEEPKQLLRDAGFTVVDVPEGHICCGSAGIYNILQPDLARQLRDRKVGHIESLRPDLVAAGNIGCITQLATGMDIPIVHTI